MEFKILGDKLRWRASMPVIPQWRVAEIIGKDRSTYAYYETGRVSPSYPTLLKLSELFDVSCDYLIDDRIPVKEFPHGRGKASPPVSRPWINCG